MAFDPLHYRFTQAAIGSPEESPATDTSQPWSMISLLKGLMDKIDSSGSIPSLSQARVKSAASTNATSVKASAGKLYSIAVYNDHDEDDAFLKLYDKAAGPTVGTDTPVWTIPVPAGGGFSEEFSPPLSFASGIAYAITGGISDSDTTAIEAEQVHGLIRFV